MEERIGKHLAIDLGDKRTGLAFCDAYGLFAAPLTTLHIEDRDELAAKIVEICEAEEIAKVVIGLPLHMDGQSGHRADLSRQFAEKLAALGAPEVVYEDERLTSWEASERLVAAGITGRERKAKLDAAAALIVLEAYLDRVRPKPPAPEIAPQDMPMLPMERGFERKNPRKNKRRR